MALLEIENLSLSISGQPILHDVDLSVENGGTLGIVGESGSGKSLTALSILQLLPRGTVCKGSLRFDGHDLLNASDDQMISLRGQSIGMVFQEPMTALNPVKTIGAQISEGMRFHLGIGRAEGDIRARRLLDEVGLPVSKVSLDRFPHQLSGGQRQRVVIAIAIALNPKLLVADEPTTALDVTTQATILDLLRELAHEHKSALVLISHDLAVVADMVDHVAIMQSGNVVEQGPTAALFNNLKQDYSKKLLAASLLDDRQYERKKTSTGDVLVQVDALRRRYPKPRSSIIAAREHTEAVQDVTFDIKSRESVGLVGESGCGKSTLARAILALEKPTSGRISFNAQDIATMARKQMADLRRNMQVIFQDPYGSFNPRQTVEKLVAEPMHLLKDLTKQQKKDRVAEVLSHVGLANDAMQRYPHEFSGGQRQRIAIARSIVTEPKLVIADEPVSALDVSIRGQILDLMAELGERLGMSYLFISHDLHVVRAVTDRVLVMQAGKIVEQGQTDTVFDNPQHDYTRTLLSATLHLNTVLNGKTKLASTRGSTA